MNEVHRQPDTRTYVISDPESDRQVTCDVPTEVVLAANLSGWATPPDEDASDEAGAKIRLVLTMLLYPERSDFIRSMFWSLIDRGESMISASRIVVAEMRRQRPQIIAAREAPQQQELDDLRAENARIGAATARTRAETARIQERNVQMDNLRNSAIYGGAAICFGAIGGLVAGVVGAIGGGIAGFLSPVLYGRVFGGDRQPADHDGSTDT
ncbi:MAG: hypothetical protein LBF26_00160 [Puniceicoccales bacterium]|nr:hypothetical protein [Puniceicoccales bacterium]